MLAGRLFSSLLQEQITQLEQVVDAVLGQLNALQKNCDDLFEEKVAWETERLTLQEMFDEANERIEAVSRQLDELVNDGD